jgi:hypothetical protein
MRRLLSALVLLLLLSSFAPSRTEKPFDDRQIVTARPVPGVTAGMRIGALTVIEAWELHSPHSEFGGLSGIALTGERAFLMINDSAYRLRLTLGVDGRAQMQDYSRLPPPFGGYLGKFHYDAEAVAHDPATGRYWTAMEGTGQIWAFEGNDVRRTRVRQPVLASWPDNGGAEVLTRLADGRFIALSERPGPSGRHEGVLFSGDPAERTTRTARFFYDPGRQGAPTDAAALPDGRMLILHRKLGWSPLFTTSIAIADPGRLRPGAVLTSRPIAAIRDPALAENYEGAAIVRDADGSLSLWLVSDDNQQDWQRTRLVRLRIDAGAL